MRNTKIQTARYALKNAFVFFRFAKRARNLIIAIFKNKKEKLLIVLGQGIKLMAN